MGYTALLFCPDEKTARTVTQVLGDLEFSVETCAEPFAAVKKLMGQHFDALVVDCDNEQNATLLFKSARNSTSNQASLAVAVVEGQAGVAKAFRIGANLVLTKPINVEQAKGTLRVARGLLRKGEPGKPASTPAPGAAATQAAAPAKPAAPKAVAPPKPVAPAVSAPRPAAPPVSKPAPPLAKPAAVASVAPAAGDDDLLEINVDDSPSTPAPAAIAPPAPKAPSVPVPVAESKPVFKAAPPVPAFGGGAASAPAPAREAEVHKLDSHVAEAAPAKTDADALFEKPAEAAHADSGHSEGSSPTFTFGGANAPVESSGGRNKIFLGVAAAVVVVVGGYLTWSHFSGAKSETPVVPAPVTASQPATPANVPAKPAAITPAASSPAASTSPTSLPSASSSQPAAQPVKEAAAPDTNADAEEDQPADSNTTTHAANSAKSAPSGKPAASSKPAAAPLMVKGGAAPAIHKAPAAPDTPAPSVIGMATPSSNAPPLNLVTSSANAPKPVLQTLNISQGVSQGLLIKKVQPTYPQNALAMHVEGSVDMMATISKTGTITAVKVVEGEPMLSRAASDAVKQWKYKPYLLNGEPVEIQTEITVNFKLPH